jgi:acyl-ACP thioesterase
MTHEDFRIRYYEAGPGGAVPLHTLCDYFQEAAGLDAHTLSFGAEDLIAANGVTWVLTRMQLEPLAKATVGAILTVHTWHSFSDKLFSRREFYMENEKKEIVLKGTTWWVLIDMNTRRLARTPESLLAMNPAAPNHVLTEHNPKTPNFTGMTPVTTLPIIVRDEDIDSNAHVNNTHFIAWALESAPKEIAEKLTLKELVITFKNECFSKDKLTLSVYEIPASAGKACWHILTREQDGRENARIYTWWE